MRIENQRAGSENLMGSGPHYHHALWSYTYAPIVRFDNGDPVEQIVGKRGVKARRCFTVDDVIDYYYAAFNEAAALQVRRVRRNADRGAVQRLLETCSLDEILFAIDVMAEHNYASGRRPPLIAVTDYIEEAIDRFERSKEALNDIIQEAFPGSTRLREEESSERNRSRTG